MHVGDGCPGTISNWGIRRANPDPAVERIADRFQLERALRTLVRRSYTLAIIDTPGSDNDITTAAIRMADLCLIPARPSLADIEAAHPTFKVIHRFERAFALCSTKRPYAASVWATSPRLERSWQARASVYRTAQRPYGFACRRSCRIGIRAQWLCRCRNPRSVGLVKTQINERRAGREIAPELVRAAAATR